MDLRGKGEKGKRKGAGGKGKGKGWGKKSPLTEAVVVGLEGAVLWWGQGGKGRKEKGRKEQGWREGVVKVNADAQLERAVGAGNWSRADALSTSETFAYHGGTWH